MLLKKCKKKIVGDALLSKKRRKIGHNLHCMPTVVFYFFELVVEDTTTALRPIEDEKNLVSHQMCRKDIGKGLETNKKINYIARLETTR